MESSEHKRANISAPNSKKMLMSGKQAFLLMLSLNIKSHNLQIQFLWHHYWYSMQSVHRQRGLRLEFCSVNSSHALFLSVKLYLICDTCYFSAVRVWQFPDLPQGSLLFGKNGTRGSSPNTNDDASLAEHPYQGTWTLKYTTGLGKSWLRESPCAWKARDNKGPVIT